MIAPKQDSVSINSDAGKKPKRNFLGILVWYLGFLILIPLFVHIANINSIKKLKIKISESEANIDTQLMRRRDTMLKLIEEVKGSIKFEKETLTTITAMRTGAGIEQSMKNASFLNSLQKNINVQIENYPNLKTNELIRGLMQTTEEIESSIAFTRTEYNQSVSLFNQKINTYPNNQAAAALKCKNIAFFEIADWDRDDVTVGF
ncbi:LemA family protein [Spiroplasma helicoides]|uniref:LemA family protein n=1 Tax=Spiroplasma helicoides TaxID=216938 RepID=A0A1B3SJS5_9MOLU|nr:LemA family protein [Spiroplasma helicoides]AOG60177.1 LemA family protein [Spiroplasma helicoides]